MQRLFWICLAGAAGTAARYLVGLWATRRFGPGFPYGTLVVNLVGCFLIAFVMNVAAAKAWSETTRLAVTVGFLGGFTTYSSFNYEIHPARRERRRDRRLDERPGDLAGWRCRWTAGILLSNALLDWTRLTRS